MLTLRRAINRDPGWGRPGCGKPPSSNSGADGLLGISRLGEGLAQPIQQLGRRTRDWTVQAGLSDGIRREQGSKRFLR
ncbi:MAG: hypothetical protein RLZZ186_1829 [Cyanobacteriota bacterium]|jgi:hypothetical protein